MDHKALMGVGVGLGLALAASARGQPAKSCTSTKPAVTWGEEPIVLRAEATVPPSVVEEAISYWNSCPQYGKGFPSFVIDSSERAPAARTLRILRATSSASRRCAMLKGSTITLYSFARDRLNRMVSCGRMAQNLAHELGHFLGLRHAVKIPRCRYNIMSTLKPPNAHRRRVVAEECRAADRRWRTAHEIEPPDRRRPPPISTSLRRARY